MNLPILQKVAVDTSVQWLFTAVIVLSVFEGAAINLASFGLAPVILAQMVMAFVWICGVLHGGIPIYSQQHARSLFWLLAFLLYCMLSALLLPNFFAGFPVYAAREGIDTQVGNETPLAFTISNIAQVIYLLLNATMVAAVLSTTSIQSAAIWRAFQFAGFFVLLFAVYEKISAISGLPFPEQLLHSNAFHYQGFDQTADGIKRISSTMSEPSLAGTVLAAYFAFYAVQCTFGGRFRFRSASMAIAYLCGTALTTSSTGYLEVLLTFGLIALISLKSLARFMVVAFIGVIVVIGAWTELYSVIDGVLLSKAESLSFAARLASDLHALYILIETYGFGVGLGSNRPSSFVTLLLSNVGLIGSFCFVAFLLTAVVPYFRNRRWLTPRQLGIVAALMVHGAGKVIASPDLNFWWFWVLITLVLWASPERALIPWSCSPVRSNNQAASGAY